MIRFALTIAIGAIVGAIIGIALPIMFALYLSFTDPEFNKGGGIIIAYMLLLTVPGATALGVIIGAVVGAFRD